MTHTMTKHGVTCAHPVPQENNYTIITARRNASAAYAVVVVVCLSVCLSVTSCSVMLILLNATSRKQLRHTMAQGL